MFNRTKWLVLVFVCVPLYAYGAPSGLPGEVEVLAARVTQLETQVEALLNQLDAHGGIAAAHHIPESIAVPILEDLLDGVSRYTDGFGNETLQFSGMNVQVVNGEYPTDFLTNGVGNLIIGYNNLREGEEGPDVRHGSHMLVIGDKNNYTADSYGGMVVGSLSETSAPYASVSGGIRNEAIGYGAWVGGGEFNIASSSGASVVGGYDNEASGFHSAVIGGAHNHASGHVASIIGGELNMASGIGASIGGGEEKTAESDRCWTAGTSADC